MFIEPYLANITIFGGNFAPRGWMFCQGQLLAIANYDALFALIGTTYGGDGQTTFALPDLRGRVANHQGQGPGLSMYYIGQASGSESVTLLSIQMPAHNHALVSLTGSPQALNAAGSVNSPAGAFPAQASGSSNYATSDDGGSLQPMSSMATSTIAGGNQPFGIISPYLAMNYIIAVEGIFPSRN